MRNEPKPLQVYRHFKGTYYQVLTVAKHSETGERLVIYRPLFGGDEAYARPLDMFLSEVDHDKYPDVKQKWRFSLATGQGNKGRTECTPNDAACDEGSALEDKDRVSEKKEAKTGDFLDRFLDADSYEEKLDIFTDMWKTISEDNIDNVATVMDLELKGESLEDKYKEILKCLKMRAKYECSRLR
ncbi:MAG: DUF1653 domain-containing protein [Lachnospiraceae bacterium]|nr:DUF1653 domain-containing protein [Lachnospiraceae bacterium]